MSGQRRLLRLVALDLGAESGRAVVGEFDGSKLRLHEAHRFPNVPVRVGGTLYWDFLRLFGDAMAGIRAARADGVVASLGVDTWGVDFGLVDSRGRLLANPVHYRDSRTTGMLALAQQRVSRAETYAATGIQLIPINTLYQLLAMAASGDPDLERADRLLLMPDLVHHFLCNANVSEYTNATTTQCLNILRGTWAVELLSRLNIPTHVFPDIVPAGTMLGELSADVESEVGGGLRVIAPATHDTGSAVVATPLDSRAAFPSSGTWSLLGLELDQPILSSGAREANLTNEGGAYGTIRLLKNVMGLWLVQQARRAFGGSYEELAALAAGAPALTAFVNPDDQRFLRVSPAEVRQVMTEFCLETSQIVPPETGTLIRVLLESLALKYAVVLRQLESVTGRTIDRINIVGGGVNNALLCQFTADATGLPVLAGPAEATAIGNLVVQAITLGELASLAEARSLVATSFPWRVYEPANDWSEARQRFELVLHSLPETEGVLQ